MNTISLSPEQHRLIDQAGDGPVRIEDSETHQAYVLMRADVYERYCDAVETTSDDQTRVPEGIRKSQEAFFRDLPELLKNRRLRNQYVAYHGDERIGIAGDDTPLIRECWRRGLNRDQYDILIIEPQSAEPDEIDYPSCWFRSFEPHQRKLPPFPNCWRIFKTFRKPGHADASGPITLVCSAIVGPG